MQKRTNIVVDTIKITKAKRISGFKTTREVVDFALNRLTQSHQAFEGLSHLRGKIHFSKNYNYKKDR